jgi:two-component system NtrC family sensor kinase
MTGQGRILLVEDNADIAEVTRSNLEELGFRVVHVPDAHSALNALERDASFDLVFTDIVMPGDLTGVDLARTIRLRYPALPVLLTTGYSNMAQAAADEGFSILHKPYDSAGLSASVNRTIRVMPLKASA